MKLSKPEATSNLLSACQQGVLAVETDFTECAVSEHMYNTLVQAICICTCSSRTKNIGTPKLDLCEGVKSL